LTEFKSAEMDVSDRVHDLAKFDEVVFSFKMYETEEPNRLQGELSKLLAKIILALPAKFSYKKVSVTDHSLIDTEFEWEMFLFYTQQTIFKQLWLTKVNRQCRPLLGFLFTRTKELYLKECELHGTILRKLPAKCEIEELSVYRSQIELPLANTSPDYITQMKRIEMNDSYLRFDDPSMLSNL